MKAFEIGAVPRDEVSRFVRGLHSRSEEHTSELQSQSNLVCRLLLEKKKNDSTITISVKAAPPGQRAPDCATDAIARPSALPRGLRNLGWRINHIQASSYVSARLDHT